MRRCFSLSISSFNSDIVLLYFWENIEIGHPFLGRATPLGGAALPHNGRPISMFVVVSVLFVVLLLFGSVLVGQNRILVNSTSHAQAAPKTRCSRRSSPRRRCPRRCSGSRRRRRRTLPTNSNRRNRRSSRRRHRPRGRTLNRSR